MMWHTHVMIGASSLWLLSPFLSQNDNANIGVLAACATLGAIIPDLDASESKIKHLHIGGIKPFYIPAQVAYRTDTHRGMLHSLTGVAFISFTTLPLAFAIGWLPWLSLILGYASHLLADSMTKSGIRLCYPDMTRFYFLPEPWRIITGSPAEGSSS